MSLLIRDLSADFGERANDAKRYIDETVFSCYNVPNAEFRTGIYSA